MASYRISRKRRRVEESGDDAILASARAQWPNKKPLGVDGVQEMRVSFLTKPMNSGDVSTFNGVFSNVWLNKKEAAARSNNYGKTKHQQRTPSVTVDTVTLKIDRDGSPLVLVGVFDKVHKQPGGQMVRCRGLVIPCGGHYERIGGRKPSSEYEAPHGSSVQAADEETLEEIGITKNAALLRDAIAVMDVAEYEMRAHCLRIIFGMLVDPTEAPETSDEIQKLFWVPLDDLVEIAKGEVTFTLNADTTDEEELTFTLKHDKMFLALKECEGFKTFLRQSHERARAYWSALDTTTTTGAPSVVGLHHW